MNHDSLEKLLQIQDYINYSIDQVSKKKNLLKEIFESSQFVIFRNSSNSIVSLKRSIDIKVLTNLVTNIFLFSFFSILYVYLRETFILIKKNN